MAWGGRDVFIDLGAELIAAEQDGKRIAVEVKSFFGRSEISELERALGQFVLYESLLERRDPGRTSLPVVDQRLGWKQAHSQRVGGC